MKRVIGLPGETMDIHDGAVWINGKKLDETYTTGPTELPERLRKAPAVSDWSAL